MISKARGPLYDSRACEAALDAAPEEPSASPRTREKTNNAVLASDR